MQATLIHTVTSLPALFAPICERTLPREVEVTNFVDDSLLRDVRLSGSVTVAVRRRLAGLIWAAADRGANAILVTCSSIGEAVEELAPFCPVPLLRVDDAMADAAILAGQRVGVTATLSTTLSPTTNLLRRKAVSASRPTKVLSIVCEGAFEALQSGDKAGHDQLIRDAVVRMAEGVDVVVLAQASMALAMQQVDVSVPVLTSPQFAVDSLAEALTEL